MDSGSARNPYGSSESAREDPPARAATRLGQAVFSVTGSLPPLKNTTATPTIWQHSEGGSSWDNALGPLPPLSSPSLGHQLSSSVGSDLGGAPVTPRTQSPQPASPSWRKGRFPTHPNTEEDDSDGDIGFDIEMDSVKPRLPFPSAVDEDGAFLPNDLGARPPSSIGRSGGPVGDPSPPSQFSHGAFGDDDESDSPMDLDSPPIGQSSPSLAPLFEFCYDNVDVGDDGGGDGDGGGGFGPGGHLAAGSGIVFPASAPATAITGFEGSHFGHGHGEFVVAPILSLPSDHPPILPGIQSIIDHHSLTSHTLNLPTFVLQALTHSTDFLIAPQQLPSIYPMAEADDEGAIQSSNDYVFGTDDESIPESPNDVVFDNELVHPDLEKYNPDFGGFCEQLWNFRVMYADRGCRRGITPPHISSEGARIAEWASGRPQEITAEDVAKGQDMQGIEWEKLELTREAARRWRQFRYVNYRNLTGRNGGGLRHISPSRQFFTFQRHNVVRCRLTHFQLRNILVLADRNNVFFSDSDCVLSYHPITHTLREPLLDLSESALLDPIRISTLGGCSSVLMAGGFNGTFVLKPLHTEASAPPTIGVITDHSNGITNHIQLIRSRHTNTPHAIVSSNDTYVRIMDTSRPDTWLAEHAFPWAINCSSTSPDSRLRAVAGDTREVRIVDADRGSTQFVLTGHQDYGFATAWSDDGHTIATGNQDQTVRIYDARNLSSAVKVIPMRMACCRSLRFSPGGGLLAMAEPADFVHLVETRKWEGLQTLSFYGEVGGVEFSGDGNELVIANCDRYVGGLMTWGRASSSKGDEDSDGDDDSEHEFSTPEYGGIRPWARRRRGRGRKRGGGLCGGNEWDSPLFV